MPLDPGVILINRLMIISVLAVSISLLGIFLLFVILYAGGVPQGICILFAVAGGSGLTWATFYLNRRFGPHGLMKLLALRQHPRRIIHRRSVHRLLERRTLPKR